MHKPLLIAAALGCASVISAQEAEGDPQVAPESDSAEAKETLRLMSDICGPDRSITELHGALKAASFDGGGPPIPQPSGERIDAIDKINSIMNSFRVYRHVNLQQIFVVFARNDDPTLVDKCIIDGKSIEPVGLVKTLSSDFGPPKRGEKVAYVWPNWGDTNKTLLLINTTVANHDFGEKGVALALTAPDNPDAKIAMEQR